MIVAATPKIGGSLVFPLGAAAAASFMAALDAQVSARSTLDTAYSREDAEVSFDVTLASVGEMDTLFEWLVAQLRQTRGPTGLVHAHQCFHALGDRWSGDCRTHPAAEYREAVG